MNSHERIWGAIDALAHAHGLTPSGLARRAGLDPTTFNRSKRVGADGAKARWPSTESLVKALEAVGADLDAFAALARADEPPRGGRSTPLLRLDAPGRLYAFDADGRPAGPAWEAFRAPPLEEEDVFALEVAGEELEPAFRDGDRLLVAPRLTARRGDRVAARLVSGEVLIGELGRASDTVLELRALADASVRAFARADLAWVARIVWASQ